MAVSAVGRGTKAYQYPTLAGRSLQKETVAVGFVSGRTLQLMPLLPRIAGALARGDDVLLHCNQSFHRGPILAAAVFWTLFRVHPKARC